MASFYSVVIWAKTLRLKVTEELDLLNKLAVLIIILSDNSFDDFPERVPVYSPKTTDPVRSNRSRTRRSIKKCELTKSLPMRKTFYYFPVNYYFTFSFIDYEIT